MLDWLDTSIKPESVTASETGDDSGEAQGNPVFPVSRFCNMPSRKQNDPESHAAQGFPVSRFSRFKNRGEPTGNALTSEEKAAGIPERLPDLLDAVAAILAPQEVEDLRRQSQSEPDMVAELCRLILTADPRPSPEEVSELDRLIVRLCELEPWLAGYLPEIQEARRCMAPADVADNLARFRQWVREAECKGGRLAWAGRG